MFNLPLRTLSIGLLLALVPCCTFQEQPDYPRPALPLPDHVADRFALPATPVLRMLETEAQHAVWHGELECGDEDIRFHLHRADLPERPLVLLVPILAGGRELMRSVAVQLVDLGYHAVWCERVASALRPPQRGPELEQLFRRTVLHQRAVLAWLRTQPDPAPPATFALGISMGGIVAAVLSAVEPGLEASACCLAGADLPSIMMDSKEPRIESWRAWRSQEDGISHQPLAQELRRTLRSDPALLAAYVDTQRVFLVSASFDDVVRPRYQDLLWEAMGRPARLTVPLGHYSAALALGPILTAVTGFYADRTPPAGGEPPLLARRE